VTTGGVLSGVRIGLADIVYALQFPVFAYFLLINTSYLVLILLAGSGTFRHARRLPHAGRGEDLASRLTPGVSVIMPAYNEAAGIVPAVQAMLSLRYPRHEVVVVDDGSTDETLARLAESFDLVKVDRPLPADVPMQAAVREVAVPRDGRTRLVVVTKDNSGKADAVNVGVNASGEDLVAIVDADSLLDPDALLVVTRRSPTTRCGWWPRAASSGSPTAAPWSRAGSPASACRPTGWPGSRWWSTCGRSCSAGPDGPGWER